MRIRRSNAVDWQMAKERLKGRTSRRKDESLKTSCNQKRGFYWIPFEDLTSHSMHMRKSNNLFSIQFFDFVPVFRKQYVFAKRCLHYINTLASHWDARFDAGRRSQGLFANIHRQRNASRPIIIFILYAKNKFVTPYSLQGQSEFRSQNILYENVFMTTKFHTIPTSVRWM